MLAAVNVQYYTSKIVDISLAKNRIAFATSRGSPILLNGKELMSAGSSESVIGVLITPGDTAFTLILYGPKYLARLQVKVIFAAFDAE